MKKRHLIELANQTFEADALASKKLEDYLETLANYYRYEQDGHEILIDIEGRIAELIYAHLQQHHETIVRLSLIDQIIHIIGQPEQLCPNMRTTNNSTHHQQKRLYRTNGILGGVAAGIAEYLNTDVTVIRVLLIGSSFFYGLTIAVYIVAWIIMPYDPSLKLKP